MRARLRGERYEPRADSSQYGTGSALFVGGLHGIGAETGTQVVAITAAAGTGSKPLGIAVLFAFIVGIFLANTGIAWLSTRGFFTAQRRQTVYLLVGAMAGAFSLVIGTLFLLNAADALPTFPAFSP